MRMQAASGGGKHLIQADMISLFSPAGPYNVQSFAFPFICLTLSGGIWLTKNILSCF